MGYVQTDHDLNFNFDIVDYSDFLNIPVPTPPPLPPPLVKVTDFDSMPMEVCDKLCESFSWQLLKLKVITWTWLQMRCDSRLS